ncbi:MAG: MBL fold metallo-hydrolase [Halanaerobiales bacterium]
MKNEYIKLSLKTSTCYLIKADNGYLLIDTGYNKDYDDFLDELNKNGVDIETINYLLLTHHHDDHAGFVNKLLVDTNLTIICHYLGKELLKTGENDMSRGGGYINKRMYYLIKIHKLFNPDWDLTFPPVYIREKDILIKGDNEELLKDIGINGRIIYTPGHTIDSISVILDDELIFCGDAAMSWPLWAGIKYCPIFVTDVNSLYNSWEKISQSGAKKVYPAHGDPFSIEKLEDNIGKYTNKSLVEFF